VRRGYYSLIQEIEKEMRTMEARQRKLEAASTK
jgi:hypothetical protein